LARFWRFSWSPLSPGFRYAVSQVVFRDTLLYTTSPGRAPPFLFCCLDFMVASLARNSSDIEISPSAAVLQPSFLSVLFFFASGQTLLFFLFPQPTQRIGIFSYPNIPLTPSAFGPFCFRPRCVLLSTLPNFLSATPHRASDSDLLRKNLSLPFLEN